MKIYNIELLKKEKKNRAKFSSPLCLAEWHKNRQTPSSPRLHPAPGQNAPSITIPLPFQDAPHERARRSRIASAEILVRAHVAAEARGEEAGRDAKDLDAVLLEHAMPL